MILCDFQSGQIEIGSEVTLEYNNDLVGLPQPGTTSGDAFDGKYKNENKNTMALISEPQGSDQIRSGSVHDKRDRRILKDSGGMITPVNRTGISPDPWTRRSVNISEELRQALLMIEEAIYPKVRISVLGLIGN